MSATTVRRHFALRHHLGPVEADAAAAPWVRQRIRRYAAAAGLEVVAAVTCPAEHESRTGRPVGPHTWGDGWAGPELVVYVDPARCATKGMAELVVAHDVGHLRWRSYGHRRVFFTRVQDLIDQVAATAGTGLCGTG